MRPSLTISSNSDGETPMYCAASTRDNPLGGSEGGRICFIDAPKKQVAETARPRAKAKESSSEAFPRLAGFSVSDASWDRPATGHRTPGINPAAILKVPRCAPFRPQQPLGPRGYNHDQGLLLAIWL